LESFHCLGRVYREELEGLLFLCHHLVRWLGYVLIILESSLWPAECW
jgi:hypothetical protein